MPRLGPTRHSASRNCRDPARNHADRRRRSPRGSVRWYRWYTFVDEARFADPDVAERWYRRFLVDLWQAGTLRFSAFATLHTASTWRLMELAQESGLRPLIGKVNMDRNAPDSLIESTAQSLADTETLIHRAAERTPNVGFIITPRFVPSTTPELMEGLGELVAHYHLPVQSHLDENRSEVAWVRDLHPDIPTYAQVYEHYGLMPRGRTVMAHCIWLNDAERALLRDRQVTVAHCAQSNLNLQSGIMPTRRYLDMGLQVALGSDVAAGHVLDMTRHIVMSIEASKALRFIPGHEDERPLRLAEAFYMATKQGGSFFGRVGSFESGYDFDALVVREGDNLLDLSVEERLERFLYAKGGAAIEERYVDGALVPRPFAEKE
ncbi:MAG: amidohydrolase family protein [Bifidobacterium mongoliense]|nr:amidohydrolase family protein [Bifidobacterium mongoliense]